MTETETPVARFLSLYARHTRDYDIHAIAAHFADPFLSANPSGTQSVRVADFAAAIPKRKALFSGLGCQSTEFVGSQETALDARYVLARTTWRMSFVRKGCPVVQIDADSTLLIDTGLPGTDPADFKILLYLSHQDHMQILRERGILSS